MIDLIAASYFNIGPFQDKNITLFFEKGKYLIKAPIGSGKSFLFFDGPTYALYKQSSRNMLNIQRKEGYIKLLFEFEGGYYLIKRQLKAGKIKDSCTSSFFSIQSNTNENISTYIKQYLGEKDDWQHTKDVEDILRQYPEVFTLEENIFKNETDLQQNIDQLIPPKEVFSSTMFLMQDAENIFELAPAERLVILKNVFGLLGIDEAKEKVQERKKELGYKLKALQDQSNFNEKFQKYLHTILETFFLLHKQSLVNNFTNEYLTTLQEIQSFSDKLTINEFPLDSLPLNLPAKLSSFIQKEGEKYQILLNQKENVLKNQSELQNQIKSKEHEIFSLQKEKEAVEQKLSSISLENIQQQKKEKADLYLQQKTINNALPLTEIANFLVTHPAEKETFGEAQNNIKILFALIQEIKNQGKLLNEELKKLDLEKENSELKEQAEHQKIKQEITSLQERKKLYEEQLQNLLQKKSESELQEKELATFHCTKIEGNCPFVKEINSQAFQRREEQFHKLLQEIEQIQQKIQEEQFETKIQKQETLLSSSSQETKSNIQQKKEGKEKEIGLLRNFLENVDFKKQEESYQVFENIGKTIEIIDQKIAHGEIEIQKQQEYQLKKSEYETTIQNFTSQIKDIQTKELGAQTEFEHIQKQINELPKEEISIISTQTKELEQTLNAITLLINDFQSTQLQIKQLQEEEKRVSNLYTILSKEILLFALGEYLPILSEIINNYLAQVVEYQISMKINETPEKLELEAKIFDSKGEREIKSLSGGQRTILKLVWMLAISSYLNTPLLFLDETINNLDGETVGKVSDMLNDFVKKREMKFYTVTHNPEIQQMEIRDEIIEVKKQEIKG